MTFPDETLATFTSNDRHTASAVTSLDDPSANVAVTVRLTELSIGISSGGSVMAMTLTWGGGVDAVGRV